LASFWRQQYEKAKKNGPTVDCNWQNRGLKCCFRQVSTCSWMRVRRAFMSILIRLQAAQEFMLHTRAEMRFSK
jgi:hypothetical protein